MSIKILCPVLLTLAALLSACSSDAEPPDAARSVEEPLDRGVRVASDNAPAQPPAGEAAPAAPEVAIARPLVGPLRVVDKRFHDNTGPRRVFFTSAFPLLRVYHDDPARGDAIIDTIARAGYQGVRVFAYLGMYANHPDTPEYTKDYYHGAEVSLDVAKATIVPLAKALHARGLRLQLSGDNHWLVPDEAIGQHWAALADALHAAGLDETVAYIDVINEYFLGQVRERAAGRLLASRDGDGQVAPVPSAVDVPGVAQLGGGGRSGTIEPGGRGDRHSRHPAALGRGHRTGARARLPERRLPLLEAPLLAGGTDGSRRLSGSGQSEFSAWAVRRARLERPRASVYFCGATVKLNAPLESCWGFNELPRLLSHIPEDISTWGHGPGGGYWWSDGRRFATLDVENWGTEQRAAIADWTIVTVKDG